MSVAGVFIVLIVVASGVWVYVDAKRLGVRRGVLDGGAFDAGAGTWAVGTLVLWIAVFPIYILTRPRYVALMRRKTAAAALLPEDQVPPLDRWEDGKTGYAIGGAAVVAVAVLAVVAFHQAQSSSGFNNVNDLESSVTQQVNTNLAQTSSGYPAGTTVTQAICVHNTGRQFDCSIALSTGRSLTVPVIVSADGSRWVSG